MSSETHETPFIKQLAASDKPTRDKALESLQLFLTSGRSFSYIELLKVWKGLYYCVYHTANPLPQQHLSNSLASLLLALPNHVFIPFLAAFFQTMVSNWSAIPSLRLDKYLYLIRVMISHAFMYLAKSSWASDLVDGWTGLMTGGGECDGILDVRNMKVGDGLRYHVLDVWADGLVEANEWEVGVENGVIKPIEAVSRDGATKTLRARAKLVVQDERLHGGAEAEQAGGPQPDSGDDFQGFE